MKSLKDYSLDITEKEYHAYPAWSHSVINKYAKRGFAALKTLNEPVVETPEMRFGTLFDTILTKGKEAIKSYLVMNVKVPEAEKNALNALYSMTNGRYVTVESVPDDIITSACDASNYYKNWGVKARKNHLSEYNDYFNALASGKTIISSVDWEDALEMARIFRNDKYLSSLYGTKSTSEIEYLYQTKFVQEIEVNGKPVKIKCMPDLIVVNHKEKTVQPVDLKTCSMPAYDFKENFVNFRYDTQASMYSTIIRIIMDSDDDYKEYRLLPYLFTTISRVDKVPVTYVYNPFDESQINGLAFKTFKYKFWRDCLSEILEYQESNAVVPKNIMLEKPNDIIEILSYGN